jgi:DNA (cytosine-5)-methyltransferase 1
VTVIPSSYKELCMHDIDFSLAKHGGRPPTLRLLDDDEIIVDCFAGGGGASLGMEWATGRKVDVAINHDPEAIAMHRANHPETEHYVEDIYDVDPVAVCRGRRVGVAWFSPDCTEHSSAKNGPIVRDKKIRGLAWVVIDWARLVRPRVILLENVSEWWDWGPLDESGVIDKSRRGEFRTFWWQRLEALGYRLSMRIMKSCDFGAPTSRKRLYIIARCDGIDPETCWPEATHGPGRPDEYRTAAECIDYSLPCPSIFMTKRQARAFTKKTGIKCKRPLVRKTMDRIRRGIYKYVLAAAKPFTLRLTGATIGSSGYPDDRVYDVDEPMRTVTGANRGEFGFVSPVLVRTAHGETSKKGNRRGKGAHSIEEPLPTVCSSSTDYALVAPTLVQTGYGERPGQDPRCLDLHAPLGTIIAGGNGSGNGKHALVQSTMVRADRADRVAAWLYRGFGHDSKKRTGGFAGAAPLAAPMPTVTARDHHQLAVSHLVKLRGTSEAHMGASSLPAYAPVPTVSAGGNHIGEVRAFLQRYNGTGDGQGVFEPLLTVTTKDRFGLVVIDGDEYQIVDIGMRMLEPRELYRAQGFPDSYVIDPIVMVKRNGRVKRLSKTAQVEKCGNSVTPQTARAIVLSALSARSAGAIRAA